MKLRPTIFLSGVSSEFASFRDAVETEVQKKDCFPLNQPSFGVDYRTIEEILRRNIGEADAVIHIVGFRFGFEHRDRPEGKPRRSYEAWEITESGPMKLFMADIHLHRARLFFREKEYPWESPEADLKAARKLIEQCGYWRRKEELEDAERVILKSA